MRKLRSILNRSIVSNRRRIRKLSIQKLLLLSRSFLPLRHIKVLKYTERESWDRENKIEIRYLLVWIYLHKIITEYIANSLKWHADFNHYFMRGTFMKPIYSHIIPYWLGSKHIYIKAVRYIFDSYAYYRSDYIILF